MNSKYKNLLSNLILVIGWIFIAFYGLYYNSFNNMWIMVFTVPFILVRSCLLGKLHFDINLLFLMETFFIKAMLDQHIGKEAIVPTTMALPMLMYLFGKLLAADTGKKVNISVLALTFGISILGMINAFLTSKSPVKVMGYYSVAFTDNTFYTDALSYYFNFIFIAAVVVGLIIFLIYKKTDGIEAILKFRGLILAFLLAITMFVITVKYIKTENFLAFKQGVGLMITKHWGNFGLDLTYNNSTSNMWLDYGRDYGILVFGTLFIFFILTIKDVIKLAVNKNVGIFTRTTLIIAFIGTNIYYFTDSFAYIYPQYWYIGLVVCGMISEVAKNEDK